MQCGPGYSHAFCRQATVDGYRVDFGRDDDKLVSGSGVRSTLRSPSGTPSLDFLQYDARCCCADRDAGCRRLEHVLTAVTTRGCLGSRVDLHLHFRCTYADPTSQTSFRQVCTLIYVGLGAKTSLSHSAYGYLCVHEGRYQG